MHTYTQATTRASIPCTTTSHTFAHCVVSSCFASLICHVDESECHSVHANPTPWAIIIIHNALISAVCLCTRPNTHTHIPHTHTSHHTTPPHTTPHLPTPHLTSPHLTSLHSSSPPHTTPHLTSPHSSSPSHTTPHLTSSNHPSPHQNSPHLTKPHLTSSHLTAPPHTALRAALRATISLPWYET